MWPRAIRIVPALLSVISFVNLYCTFIHCPPSPPARRCFACMASLAQLEHSPLTKLRPLQDRYPSKQLPCGHQTHFAPLSKDESTNRRVLYFTVFSMFCLLGLATWQVFYLRNYFKAKKLIE